MTDSHARFMQTALGLARRNLGQTWPNPAVGALVVQDGQIIAEGWTQAGGRPHAETVALSAAGKNAKDATLYVTLEPCSHHGKTPPCAEAIINAGIARCVVACRDPNPLVNGAGIAQLKKAGIEVFEDVCREEAETLNRGFFSVVQKGRPYVAVKIATSADEKITTGNPDQRWLTGEAARVYAHKLRSEYDAILTGIGTVLADDPLLTCRLPGLEHRSPVRVVLDRKGRLPQDSQLMKTAKDVPVWVMDTPLEETLSTLAQKGITRLLVEGGQQITSAFLEANLADRLYWFKAPVTVGKKGLAAWAGDASDTLLAHMKPVEQIMLAPDRLEIWESN